MKRLEIMQIKKISRVGESCNFCNDGVLASSGRDLIYPYDEVIHLSSDRGGIACNVCPKCLTQLSAFFKVPGNKLVLKEYIQLEIDHERLHST